MTVPRERRMAVHNARSFLRDLLDPKKTPRVPKEIRRQAYYVLKHFPSDHEIERARTGYDGVFGDKDDMLDE